MSTSLSFKSEALGISCVSSLNVSDSIGPSGRLASVNCLYVGIVVVSSVSEMRKRARSLRLSQNCDVGSSAIDRKRRCEKCRSEICQGMRVTL